MKCDYEWFLNLLILAFTPAFIFLAFVLYNRYFLLKSIFYSILCCFLHFYLHFAIITFAFSFNITIIFPAKHTITPPTAIHPTIPCTLNDKLGSIKIEVTNATNKKQLYENISKHYSVLSFNGFNTMHHIRKKRDDDIMRVH